MNAYGRPTWTAIRQPGTGLDHEWRDALKASSNSPRSDATAWLIIEELPAYPYITAPIATVATKRSRPQVYEGIEQLVAAGIRISAGKAGRAQAYEVRGLLDLMEALERGDLNDNG